MSENKIQIKASFKTQIKFTCKIKIFPENIPHNLANGKLFNSKLTAFD
jgi:hypothetical protein